VALAAAAKVVLMELLELLELQTQEAVEAVEAVVSPHLAQEPQAVRALSFFATPAQFNISLVAQ
jgi:hypothetical protein